MASRRQLDATILDLARPARSVVHARELRAAGVSRDAVRHRIATGFMARVLPRTYVVGPECHQPSFESRCVAGAKHAGPGAVVDGTAAARIYGVWDRGSDVIDITTRRHPPRSRGAYRFHESSGLRDTTTLSIDGIPVARFPDVCMRLAATLTKWQLAWVIGRGLYSRRTTLDELDAVVEAHRGEWWVTTIRDAVSLVRSGSAGTRGPSEDRLLAALLAAGVPEPIVNTRGAMGLHRDEPDFLWRDGRLNVEVDGGHHDVPAQAADDRRRDEDAAALGVLVGRVSARIVYARPHDVARWIAHALAGEPVRVDPDTRRMVLR